MQIYLIFTYKFSMINTYGILWEQIKGGEEVFWFKKKGGKPKAAIFVDYEHWYYGYRNNFQMKPNIEERQERGTACIHYTKWKCLSSVKELFLSEAVHTGCG